MATGWRNYNIDRYSTSEAVRPDVVEQRRRDQELLTWREPPLKAPPLPPSMPMVGPVAGLKQQVARDFQPYAARALYDTPTQVAAMGPGDYGPLGPARGVYYNPEQREKYQAPYEIVTRNLPDTLRHEFAHKWYATEMPEQTRNDWNQNHEWLAPGPVQHLNDDYWMERQYYRNTPNPNEVYARAVEDYPGGASGNLVTMPHRLYGGREVEERPGDRPVEFNYEAIDPAVRNKYFAGMFQGDQANWDDPYMPARSAAFVKPQPTPEPPSVVVRPEWMDTSTIPRYWPVPTADRLRERRLWTPNGSYR